MQAMVLLSGGLDSTTVATHALREGHDVRAISIGYGQRHVRELRSARAVAKALGIPLIEADASFYAKLASYSALTDPATFAVPEQRDPATMAADIPITYVPLRNTFFMTVAAAALESWLLALIEQEGRDPASLAGAIYVGKEDVPRVLGGLGINILTTSQGIMTGAAARKMGVGGEVLCQLW